MDLEKKRLGLLVSVAPSHRCFGQAVRLAEAARARKVEVYFYCLDEAISGVGDERLQRLRTEGLRLFGCALAARRRGQDLDDRAVYGGLGILADIVASSDRFLAFN